MSSPSSSAGSAWQRLAASATQLHAIVESAPARVHSPDGLRLRNPGRTTRAPARCKARRTDHRTAQTSQAPWPQRPHRRRQR